MTIKKKSKRALTPKLRFPEFLDASGWIILHLGELCSIKTGKKDANEGAADGRYPFFTCAEDHSYSHSFSFDTEAILVAGNANVGQAKYYNGKFEAYQRTYVLADFSAIDVQYLYAYLAANLRPSLLRQVQTSAMSYIKLPMLQQYKVVAPPDAPEQQKIAECLSSLDGLITAEGRTLEALKTHKKGLMQQLFPQPGQTQPRLRFPEFRDKGEWKTIILGDIVSISKGKGIAKSDVVVGGTTPCIRYAELYTIYGEVITHVRSRTDVPVDTLVLSQVGDVIIPASGETKEDIATCGCVMNAGVALGSDLNVLRSDIDGRFFSYYLNGVQRSELAKVAQGDTVAHLYPAQISRLSISVAEEPAEQHRIADCLSALDAQIAAQAGKIETLKQHKRGLMQQIFPAPEEQ